MSFTDLGGAKVAKADQRLDALLPAEAVYLAVRKGRRRHLAIFRLRIGYDWSYSQIAEAMSISKGHACRITRQVLTALERISREINLPVALSKESDDE